jgi:hypothetical protein
MGFRQNMSDNTSDDRDKLYAIFRPYIRNGYDEDMRLTIDNGDTYHEILHEIESLIAHKVNEARIKQTKRIYGMLEPMNDFTDAVPTEKLDDELERLAELKTDTTEY